MIKILTVVGARPQFVKAAMVSQAFRHFPKIKERILHTGQHYDFEMSEVFFKEMGIPTPYKHLKGKGKTQGDQTGKILLGIEQECFKEKPDYVLVYGDTNSTLAGALAASKLQIPITHVEAGLRSFNRKMPEEINRIITDRLSTILFVPTNEAFKQLKTEGIVKGVYNVGDVMIDAIYEFRERVKKIPSQRKMEITPQTPFFVLTLHRQENTDDIHRLSSILKSLSKSPLPFLFPAHPRTKKMIKIFKLKLPKNIRLISPVTYLEMIHLQIGSEGVWTDSGGVQKEAVVLGKHCFTLRNETEWVETVKEKWNQLLGADPKKIEKALQKKSWEMVQKKFPTNRYYGDGKASLKIARILSKIG